ncbi:MAG: hypothetical protein OXN17_02665 [Candidatus Poribacteria bacterium]|nr:hypothetical protein [Candidatus Poribacteria bacterium]MDE0502714.1 hypothetical protein [Candidatus Poribacteria bacterium]
MNFGQKITISLFLTIVLESVAIRSPSTLPTGTYTPLSKTRSTSPLR